jgi:hypothetical protein
MTTKSMIAGALAWLWVLAAQAGVPAEWKSCGREISQYCSKATDSAAIFECIEKREKLGKKSGLSQECLQAHEKYEKAHPEPGGAGY